MTMSCDVMIVGAGPVGLAFARSLAESGLEILIVEQAELATLKAPPPDGRAIALNHRSMGILERLDVAGRFAPEHRSLLRRAEVLDGASPFALVFDAAARNAATLGWLVPNHAIRKAVFESFSHHGGARLMAGAAGLAPPSGSAPVARRHACRIVIVDRSRTAWNESSAGRTSRCMATGAPGAGAAL